MEEARAWLTRCSVPLLKPTCGELARQPDQDGAGWGDGPVGKVAGGAGVGGSGGCS